MEPATSVAVGDEGRGFPPDHLTWTRELAKRRGKHFQDWRV